MPRPAGAYGLVGMGAVFAGATRAPITGVLIIFELTGDYTIVLPLMVAIVLATAVSGRLSKDTIYTLKLRRRGIDIARGRPENLMRTLTVSDAMQPVPVALSSADPLEQIVKRFTDGGPRSATGDRCRRSLPRHGDPQELGAIASGGPCRRDRGRFGPLAAHRARDAVTA